ncbi:MAG: tetratricopeptide (TPR) repeat protein [Rhodothermales bacterium]|jgi:tetratricopeptide (TPR) repeat protein
MDESPISKLRDYHLLAILALAIGLYANTFRHQWALDDAVVYTSNQFVRMGVDGIPKLLSQDSFAGFMKNKSTLSGGRYRPLSLVSFAVEVELWGQNPGLSHVVNTVLYGLTGILLYLIIVRLMGEERRLMAFFTTLLFIAHPLHTEVVANVKGRDEILCLLFILAAGHCLLTYLEEEGVWRLVAASASFGLALLSKESAITFLAIFPVALFTFRGVSVRRCAQVVLPFAVLALGYVLMRAEFAGMIGDRGSTDVMTDPLTHASTTERYGTIFMALGRYIKLLLFPHPLVYDYSFNQIPLVTLGAMSAWIPLAIHAALAGIVVYGVRKRCPITFVILFYLATLSIYSNLLFPIGAILAERFLYMPSLAFCAVLGTLLAGATRPAMPRGLGIGLLVLILFAYSAKSVSRNAAWKDNWTLTTTDITNAMNSARAHYSLGDQAMRRYKGSEEEDKELLDRAEAHFRKALAIHDDGMVRNWLGDALIKKGLRDEAMEQFEAASKLLGSYYGIHVNRGNWLLENNRLTNALAAYKTAHELDPVRADVARLIVYLLVEAERFEESLPYLQYILQHKPDFVDGHVCAAKAMNGLGKPDLALLHAENALRLDPTFADTFYVRGSSLHKLGRVDEAIESFKSGLDLEKNPEAHLDLGVIFHSQNRMEEAKSQFEAVLAAKPSSIRARINLGSMQLQAGDKPGALKYFLAILDHHPANNDARVRSALLMTDMGKPQDGIDLLLKGLEVQTKSVLLNFHVGAQLAAIGNKEAAKKHYKEAVEAMPTYGPAQNNLGSLYLDEGEIEKALGHLRLAVQAQPKNSRAHNNLANALGRDEKTYDEALVHYQKAIELDPKYGSPHFNAFLIYLQRQHWDQAERYLLEADKLLPDNPTVKKNLSMIAKIRAELAKQAAEPPEK